MADRPEPERRRRRPAVVCNLCRKRKLRCNRETPCSNCVRSKGSACVYENFTVPAKSSQPTLAPNPAFGSGINFNVKLRDTENINGRPDNSTISAAPSVLPRSLDSASRSSSNLANPSLVRDVELLTARVRQLEDQLSVASLESIKSPSVSNSDIEIVTSHLGSLGIFHSYRDGNPNGQTRAVCHSVFYKSRLWGRSNWINDVVVFLDLLDLDSRLWEESSQIVATIRTCKYLARRIKQQRAPLWPCPPTTDLPPRALADELIGNYLRTTETFYRILHIPKFKQDCETVWASDVKPDVAFLVQLKLVLALGAATYDDLFSLRTSAVRWVYEAHTWISAPEFKPRMGISYLQTSILLLLAREAVNISGDTSWISAGALLRTAMVAGLHRDPSRFPKRTLFIAEMHRRIWNTIVELSVQSSLASGGPPLVSLTDFDTEAPGNFDDEDILDENASPKSEGKLTQTSLSIAFRKTLPIRLKVLHFLNGINSSHEYEETLQLDSRIRISYKSLRSTIHSFDSSEKLTGFRFGMILSDLFMLRYISALHSPYLDPSLSDVTYAFSRKVVIETSLAVWRAVSPKTAGVASHSRNDAAALEMDDLPRYATCASGHLRTIAMQAPILVAMEVKRQLQDESGLGSVHVRPDMLSVIDEAKGWYLRCIEAGETNIKAYLFICLVAAQIQETIRATDKGEIFDIMTKTANDANNTALSILEKMISQGRDDGTLDERHQISPKWKPDVNDDWDFMVPEAFFIQGNSDPMNWIFDDDEIDQAAFGTVLESPDFE